MDRDSKFVSVLVDQGVSHPLDYSVPEELSRLIGRGMQVKVPLRGATRTGYIVAIKESPSYLKVLPIQALVSEDILLNDELFELGLWISQYYNAPLYKVLKILLPSSVRQEKQHKEQFWVKSIGTKEELRAQCIALREKHPTQTQVLELLLQAPSGLLLTELLEKAAVSKSPINSLEKKGFLQVTRVRIGRSPLVGEEYLKTEAKTLNPHQRDALNQISASLCQNLFETHLIYGITGSGKTEVYLQAIEKALSLGKSTIMLVPEISLTGQTVERFRARFDGHIALLHHRLSQGEKLDEWHRIRRGEASIVIGARSALFSPVKNLGLIIVDEEHDSAYKQSEEPPCYHARDVAVMRGKLSNAVVVLGSATPSLESYYNTQIGKYKLTTLPSRATLSSLPKVHIVDMKKEYEKALGYTNFSELLIDKIKKRLHCGEQTILFLNRRGYHTSLQCIGCGMIFQCPACDLALTFHRGENILACHMCDFRINPAPKNCPKCRHGEALKFKGVGTEQVERSVHALFPEARTLRIDGDTTRHKGSHERLFRTFQTQKADIMIGTQMVAKGLHFPAVTLVAVLNCDGGLHIPDFRASERMFQLITQVAGRAGREELPGEVVIQTQMPEHEILMHAARQDFNSFYKAEIESRKIFGFPPFSHLVKLTFSGPSLDQTQKQGLAFCRQLAIHLRNRAELLPLVPSGHPKIKELYRFQSLIRSTSVASVNQALAATQRLHLLSPSIRLHIDVDPLATFF